MYIYLMRMGLVFLGLWFLLWATALDMKSSDEMYERRNFLIYYSGYIAVILLSLGGFLYAVS